MQRFLGAEWLRQRQWQEQLQHARGELGGQEHRRTRHPLVS